MIGLNRRRTMGNALPYDAEVEYIQAHDGAYIDTGIKASSSLEVKIDVIDYFNNTSLFGKWPFGGRNGANDRAFGCFVNGLNYHLYQVIGTTSVQRYYYTNYPNTATVKMGKGVFNVGNISNPYSISSFVSTYNLYLFCLNNGGTPTNSDGIKLGKSYITDGTTTLDLIPVRVGNNGCMYDKISNRLLYSPIGYFSCGNDIN